MSGLKKEHRTFPLWLLHYKKAIHVSFSRLLNIQFHRVIVTIATSPSRNANMHSNLLMKYVHPNVTALKKNALQV